MSELLENIRSHPEFAMSGLILPLHFVEIDTNVVENGAEYIKQMGFESPILVVSDQNTYQVLGARLESVFKAAGLQVISAIFGDEVLKPDACAVKNVRAGLKNAKSCIAVGSGTINDICKYASFLEKKPYAVFASAPSMNGYVSANASIIVEGRRTSVQAHMPVGVFMDLDVLAAAPKRLIRSGIGDMLCRSTAQADWLLSHLILDTAYQVLPFSLLAEEEEVLLEEAESIVAGDIEGIRALSHALIKSGIGMWMARGSYPASQGEHMIAHVMEMAFPNDSARSYHGEQIAVTTLAMAAIQEKTLRSDAYPLYQPKFDELLLKRNLPVAICKESKKLWTEKPVSEAQAKQVNQSLSKKWADVTKKIDLVRIRRESLSAACKAAGLGVTPESIGWQTEKFKWAVDVAYMTRNRFTFLDLLVR